MGNKFCWTSYFGHISCAHKFIHSVPPVHSIIISSSSASKSFSLVLSLIYTTLRHFEITIPDNVSSRKIPAIWIVSEVLWKLPLWKVSLCHVRCEGIHEDNWGQSWPVIQLSKDLIPKWHSWTSRSIDLKKKNSYQYLYGTTAFKQSIEFWNARGTIFHDNSVWMMVNKVFKIQDIKIIITANVLAS